MAQDVRSVWLQKIKLCEWTGFFLCHIMKSILQGDIDDNRVKKNKEDC